MTDSDAALIASLPGLAFAFMLILARVGAAMMLLPGLGEASAPAVVRISFALGITILLVPGIAPSIPPVPEAGLQAALMIAAEVVTGLWLGWLARMLVLALPVAGQFIAYMLGVSNVLQPDAELGGQATPIARVFGMAGPLVLLVTGLYSLPIAALAGSYRLIEAGTLLPGADAADTAVGAAAQTFSLALQLASPFLLATIVWHVATGVMSRLVPHLQVYFVAMPGQILGGLFFLAALSTIILASWQAAVRIGFMNLPGL